jgi:small subunit ribosomal protein S18
MRPQTPFVGGFADSSSQGATAHPFCRRSLPFREPQRWIPPTVQGSLVITTKSAAAKKKRRRFLMRRRRSLDPNLVIDYKFPDVLKRFITDRGKIIPRRISGATQSQQRQIALSVKRARFLALIPAAGSHEMEKGFSGEVQLAAQTFTAAAIRTRGPRDDERGGGPRHPFPNSDRGERGGPSDGRENGDEG